MTTTPFQRLARRFSAVAAAGALTAGALAMASAPAQAASVTTTATDQAITGARLTWGLSNEQGGGAFFGGCNFLSAGKAGNTGSSRLWTEADGFYKTTDGNVTVEKPNAAGVYGQPTWATKCQDRNGSPVLAALTSSKTENRINLAAGKGSFNTATGAGSIQWTGSFTSVFYGGLTYWSATNPKLTVNADGTGTLTATASGYGADMDDTSQWTTIADTTITLASFSNVTLDQDGFASTPTYLGTAITTTGTPQPAKSSANEAYWGAFPQSYVDFQVKTGQSSYWYTSGGARDAAKPATEVGVSYAALPAAEVTVSETKFNDDSETNEVTVTGKNFDPTLAIGTRPPFQNSQSGVYIAFGRYADTWRPSQGAASSTRVNPSGDNGTGAAVKWAVPAASFPGAFNQDPTNAAYTELKTDGTFTTTVKANQSWLSSATGNYGIYTYAGGGPTVAAYETGTPVSFKKDTTTTSLGAVTTHSFGDAVTLSATVTGATTGSVSFYEGETKLGSGDLTNGKATLRLAADLAVGPHTVTASFDGSATAEASESAAQTFTVKAATTATAASVTKKPTTKATGTIRVVVRPSVGTQTPQGNVAVVVTKGSKSYTVKGKLNAAGGVNLTLPKVSAAGKWRVTARYGTTTNHVGSFKSYFITFTK